MEWHVLWTCGICIDSYDQMNVVLKLHLLEIVFIKLFRDKTLLESKIQASAKPTGGCLA